MATDGADVIEIIKADLENAVLRARIVDAFFYGLAAGFIAGVALVLAIWATR